MESLNDLLRQTTAHDDVNILINLICQLRDGTPAEEVSAAVPDPSRHCKYWEEFGVAELVRALEAKYRAVPGVAVPAAFLTGY